MNLVNKLVNALKSFWYWYSAQILLVAGVLTGVLLLNLGGCNYRKVSAIEKIAPEYFTKSGFEVLAYEGYMIGDLVGSPGGRCYYVIRRPEAPNVIYQCNLSLWNGSPQMYNLHPMVNTSSLPVRNVDSK